MSSTSSIQNPGLKDHTIGKCQHLDLNTGLPISKAHDLITLAVCKISSGIFVWRQFTHKSQTYIGSN